MQASTDQGSTYAIRANLDAIRPGTYYGLLFSLEVGPGNEMIVGAETEGFQHSFDDGVRFTPVDNVGWATGSARVRWSRRGRSSLPPASA